MLSVVPSVVFLQLDKMNYIISQKHCCQRFVTMCSPEPPLQPLSEEQFHYRSANVKDGAHLDVSAESFWGQDRRMAFF